VIAALLAVGCVVLAVVTGVRMYHTDGYLHADGDPYAVSIRDGDHMLFVADGDPVPSCTVRGASGALELESIDPGDNASLGIDDVEWVPFARFNSDGPSVSTTCSGDGEQVRVGAPAGNAQFVTLGVSVIAAMGLGLLGVVGLIVVAVLYISRRPKGVIG
jgi:hypothetical protein